MSELPAEKSQTQSITILSSYDTYILGRISGLAEAKVHSKQRELTLTMLSLYSYHFPLLGFLVHAT